MSNLLNLLGRVRISYRGLRADLAVGDPRCGDALDGTGWRDYLDPEKLYDVWGPVPGSPWIPYHSVPLFAALSRLRPDRIGPTPPDQARQIEGNGQLGDLVLQRPLGQVWAARPCWVVLDLPGPTSVAAAIRFMAGGFQPVCTFDHWPHPRGLLKPERVLAQLLRYATLAADLRRRLTPASPPLWVGDRERLGTRPGTPREFDNRYFFDDSALPGADVLRRAGIEQIVCVLPTPGDRPRDDLRAYFRDLRRDGFAAIHGAAWSDPVLAVFPFPEDVFNVRFSTWGFRRSDAGGFGQLIPEPSSGGG